MSEMAAGGDIDVGGGNTEAAVQGTEAVGQAEAEQEASAFEYADFSVPESVAFNPELLGEFKGVAGALGLSQAHAQQLADLGAKLSQQLAGEYAARQQAADAALLEAFNVGEGAAASADFAQPEAIAKLSESWRQAVVADREIGGTPERLAEQMAIAAKAVEALASPALKELFNKTGLGNHPELVRVFVKAGKLLSADRLLPGGTQPVSSGKTLAERLYPGNRPG